MLLYSRQGEAQSASGPIEVGSCGGPTVPLFPAPWRLRGNGLIAITRTPLTQLQADSAIPADIRASLRAPLNILMLVNYAQSDCGPYQELLYVPGTALIGEKRLPTISNIFVSSEASVVNGRLNWGIPKYRCQFEWGMLTESGTDVGQMAGGIQRFRTLQDGKPFFSMDYEGSGLKFPVNTSWIPRMFKTLGQDWDSRHFIYSPSAKGYARRAKIHALDVASGLFPAISSQQVLAAFEITDFEMEFPVPQIL